MFLSANWFFNCLRFKVALLENNVILGTGVLGIRIFFGGVFWRSVLCGGGQSRGVGVPREMPSVFQLAADVPRQAGPGGWWRWDVLGDGSGKATGGSHISQLLCWSRHSQPGVRVAGKGGDAVPCPQWSWEGSARGVSDSGGGRVLCSQGVTWDLYLADSRHWVSVPVLGTGALSRTRPCCKPPCARRSLRFH